MSAVVTDLSGVRLAFRGLPPALAAVLHRHWSRYVTSDDGPIWLELGLRVGGDPAPGGAFSLRDMQAEFPGGGARFLTPHGTIELDDPRRARVRLAPAEPERQYFALVNLLCAALAWSLPSCGGALLHAACVVLSGRAFALVGPSGAGKTTWAEAARSRGALFLSDDLVFVAASEGGAEALSAPIRADHPEPCGPRRWPLAALLLPVHGRPPALAPVTGLRAAARVAANLPFVGERLGVDPRLGRVVDRLLAGVAVFELTFAPDAGFVDCLASLPNPRG